MEQASELQRLEKFVEKILTKFSVLKEEKAQLEKVLAEQESLIEELKGSISVKVSERNEISDRVNKIVGQIEEWELTLDPEEQKAPDSSFEVSVVGDSEESGETQEVGNVDDEEEKRVQHDLFSMTDSRE